MRVDASERFLEIIPGLLIWLTFIFGVALSFIKPLWVIYFIILFDLFWVLRLGYFITYLLISWRKYRKTTKVEWYKKMRQIPGWEKNYHLIFFPTYKEPIEVLENTFTELCKINYPLDKLIIVLGGEEREREDFLKRIEPIKEKYAEKFHKFMVTVHPLAEDEVPGKGSNLNYMGRQAKAYVDEQGIPYENIIVSSFDVDTVTHPNYFAYLTYLYMTVPEPTKCSYQPVALFGNNIWSARSIVRISAFGTTFWLFSELARPDRLWTFASHSMSFKMLVDVGFWQKDIVTEDSRIFLQGLMRYDGNYRVEPVYLPVSMDAVSGENYWEAAKNLYKQQRRWAWGVEHFPYLIKNFNKNKLIPLKTKIKFLWNHIEGMYTWAVAPMLIFALGYLPLITGQESAEAHALFQNAPYTLESLMRIATVGIFISAILSLMLLPHRPATLSRHKYLFMLLQWLLLPVTFVVFGALPAIDAQTRLMLGGDWRLGFNVTAKKR
jgi:cellulose synthase/poly-beta-1,6-N-acetylglucosamine synthase-like glycosyltransferase